MITRLVEGLNKWFERLDKRSNGWLGEFRRSVERFNEMRGTEAAASLAYYALFSMFPLTLFFVAIMGLLLGRERAYQTTLEFMQTIFPFSGEFIRETLQGVLDRSGTYGIFAALGLLWGASAFFSTLARNINRAWPSIKLRSVVHSRLVAVSMIGVLVLLLMLSLISTTLINMLPGTVAYLGLGTVAIDSAPWRTMLWLVPALFTYTMFAALYRWVPNRKVQWRAVFTGALFVTVVWELAKTGFAYYLGSGWIDFALVYGTLGTLIALLIWIYFSNLVTLFGSYIVAMLDMRAELRKTREDYEARIEAGIHKGIRG